MELANAHISMFKGRHRSVDWPSLGPYNFKTTHRITLLTAFQNVIDHSIHNINAAVRGINMEAGVVAPWIANTVHTVQHGVRYHRYNRLRDGLHPSDYLIAVWSTKIVSCIRSNLDL